MDIKELYYEADTRKHQQIVAKCMTAVAKKILDRAMTHDASKLCEPEKSYYIDPVFTLNTEQVPFGSERYKALIGKMDVGWNHHKTNNDHHPEFFVKYSSQTPNDPIRNMDMFALFEMLCDWIAAAERRENDPTLALDQMIKKYPIDEQLQAIIRNTLAKVISA